MKYLLRIFVVQMLVAIWAVAFSTALYADEFPSRPITFVAAFGPGSASDTLCRIIGDQLSTALKQPIIVEDRPGADGAVAAQYVQHAPADGYTLMLATNSPLSADPFLLREVSYDPARDFDPVTRVGSFTLTLVINPNLPIHSVRELVDYARANPGKLSYASGNTAGVVGGKTLAHWAGLDMLHVPYKSTPPAIEDVIAGRVSMMFADFTVAMPHVASGQVRALAVTRLKRSPLFPDLPTLDEAGLEAVLAGEKLYSDSALLLGSLYEAHGLYAEAEAQFRRLVELNPSSALPGEMLASLKQLRKAS